MHLDDIRREYVAEGLSEDAAPSNPFILFETWMKQAIDAKFKDPTAMTLATVDAHGAPSQRIVLLKAVEDDSFVFFTNYGSNKAEHIEQNNRVSLHFPWHAIERQVKVLGWAEKISTADSLRYFVSRPRESQLAAWASRQSHRINSRQFLMSQFESMKAKFQQGDIPLPDFWGGYRVKPVAVEFWQGRENRLHDRLEYGLDDQKQWQLARLAP